MNFAVTAIVCCESIWQDFTTGSRSTILKNNMTKPFDRITFDSGVMGGKACIRDLRVTAGTLAGLVAAGRSVPEILNAYPYIEEEDIRQALAFAAWRLEEIDIPMGALATA